MAGYACTGPAAAAPPGPNWPAITLQPAGAPPHSSTMSLRTTAHTGRFGKAGPS